MLNEIKHLSQNSFIELFEYIIFEMKLGNIYFSEASPLRDGNMYISREVKIDIVLAGEKSMLCAVDGQVTELIMQPGDVHYCPPGHWKFPLWNKLHVMSSIVFYDEYVRVTYIDYNNYSNRYLSHGADKFYHTSSQLSKHGEYLLRILNELAVGKQRAIAEDLLKALLKIVLEELKNDHKVKLGKSLVNYMKIKHFLEDNYLDGLTRESLAEQFNITPTHLSRLFKVEGDTSFSTMLRNLRLEHAAMLLKNSDLSIDEIADESCYKSSSNFITKFKQYFGVSPGKYRLQYSETPRKIR